MSAIEYNKLNHYLAFFTFFFGVVGRSQWNVQWLRISFLGVLLLKLCMLNILSQVFLMFMSLYMKLVRLVYVCVCVYVHPITATAIEGIPTFYIDISTKQCVSILGETLSFLKIKIVFILIIISSVKQNILTGTSLRVQVSKYIT